MGVASSAGSRPAPRPPARGGERGGRGSAATLAGGHLWGPAPPRGSAEDRRPEDPKRAWGTPRGPSGPAWNLPSTVFFLKKDAMVKDRAQAARLGPGPVRSGPARDWEGTGGQRQALGGLGAARPKDGRRGQGPQRGAPRSVPAKPTAADSPGAQVTVN